MNNFDSILMNLKVSKKISEKVPCGGRNKTPKNSFKKIYKLIMDNTIKKHKETENRKKYRLSVIIQKLLAGIILTSDELQFLKSNAPAYYNKAMQQLGNYRAKKEIQDNMEVSAIQPSDKV